MKKSKKIKSILKWTGWVVLVILVCFTGATISEAFFSGVHSPDISETGSEANPMLIDNYLPEYDFTEVYEVEIEATPEIAYRAIKEATLSDMSVVICILLGLRELPEKIFGNKSTGMDSRKPILSQMQSGDSVILEEQAPGEIVFGMIVKGREGRFWEKSDNKISIASTEEFLAFKDPEYCWVISHFLVKDTANPGKVIVRTESRTMGLSIQAAKEFKPYWSVISPFSGLIRRLMLKAIKTRAEILMEGL
jgi:hypothetical protein